MKFLKIFALLTVLSFGLSSEEQSSTVKGGNMDAILLVTFGTSEPDAKKAFVNIERLTKEKFPISQIRWAYTSEIIRKKLAKQGEMLDSVEEAMEKLRKSGVKKVVVQSLHIIPGEEFHDLIKSVSKFKSDFERISVSPPLLNSADDLRRTVKIMLSKIPSDRKKEDAVIFMGHGSPTHPSDMIYLAAAYYIEKTDENAFLATVEGNPTFDETLEILKAKNIKKAYILPFMSVAGDHAKNDMAGDDPDSWKSILTKNGIDAVPVLKGMAEYDEIVNIWLDHLAETIKGL
jgi:sirohydrochlorin cobaltochelatase